MSRQLSAPIYRTLRAQPKTRKVQAVCLPVTRFSTQAGRLIGGKVAEQFKTKALKFDDIFLDDGFICADTYRPTFESHAFSSMRWKGQGNKLHFLTGYHEYASFFASLELPPMDLAILSTVRKLYPLFMPEESCTLPVFSNARENAIEGLFNENPFLQRIGSAEEKAHITDVVSRLFRTTGAGFKGIAMELARIFDGFAKPALAAEVYPDLIEKLGNTFSGTKIFVFSIIPFDEIGERFLNLLEMGDAAEGQKTWGEYLSGLGRDERKALDFIKRD